MSNINYVLSYINPDTDGIACSIAMAKLLSSENEEWIPGFFGGVGEETLFLLDQLGIPVPDVDILLNKAEKIVLVDTHHKAQLPADFPYGKVVAVIDHHPNGDDELFPKADIKNQKVGAAASLVAERYLERRIDDKPVLRLLAYAILSNTLNFYAPSSSEFDKDIFKQICDIVPIEETLIDKMFEHRSLVLKKDIYTALGTDFKIFETKKGRVGISQIEAYNLEKLVEVSQCVAALQRIADEKELEFCFFNGVDIKLKRSIVVAGNQKSQELLGMLFQLKECKEFQIFDRILLRKTDFIPRLNL